MLNELLVQYGFAGWKPVLGALALPPVPFLLLMIIGAGTVRRRPGWSGLLVLGGAAGIWLSSTLRDQPVCAVAVRYQRREAGSVSLSRISCF